MADLLPASSFGLGGLCVSAFLRFALGWNWIRFRSQQARPRFKLTGGLHTDRFPHCGVASAASTVAHVRPYNPAWRNSRISDRRFAEAFDEYGRGGGGCWQLRWSYRCIWCPTFRLAILERWFSPSVPFFCRVAGSVAEILEAAVAKDKLERMERKREAAELRVAEREGRS